MLEAKVKRNPLLMCPVLLRLSALVILILTSPPEVGAQCSCNLNSESKDPLLAWIASQQRSDGRWSRLTTATTDNSVKAKPTSRSKSRRGENRDLGVTGLSLLSLLGSGTTHQVGKGRGLVRSGLLWVKKQSSPTGLISVREGASRLTDHAIATLALCEVTRRSKSDFFKPAAMTAVAWLLNRIKSGRMAEKDNSQNLEATAFAYCALRSAERSGFSVDTATLKALASSVRIDAGSSFLSLCTSAMMRSLEPKSPQRRAILTQLMDRLVAHKDARTMTDPLAVYFGSIAAYQAGGDHWSKWRKLMSKPVVELLDYPFPKGTVWAASPSLFPDHVGSVALRLLSVELYYGYATVFGSDR